MGHKLTSHEQHQRLPVGIKDFKAIDVQHPYNTAVLSSSTFDLQTLVYPAHYPREEVVIYGLGTIRNIIIINTTNY